MNAAAAAQGGELSVEQGGPSPAGCGQAQDRKVAPTLLHAPPLPAFRLRGSELTGLMSRRMTAGRRRAASYHRGMAQPFTRLPAVPELPALEQDILEFWQRERVFDRLA